MALHALVDDPGSGRPQVSPDIKIVGINLTESEAERVVATDTASAAAQIETEVEAEPSPPLGPDETLERWLAVCATAGLPNTLRNATDAPNLDLTHAHPSGIAALLAGRATKLSSLIREPATHISARNRLRDLVAAVADISQERGLASCFLGSGWITWRPEPEAPPVLDSPIVLRGCTVRPTGAGHDDYDLDVENSAQLNPQVVGVLREAGVVLDAVSLAGLAFGVEGFDPTPVINHVQQKCNGLTGAQVRPALVVASLTDGSQAVVDDLQAARSRIVAHPVLGHLRSIPEPPASPPPDLAHQAPREFQTIDPTVAAADSAARTATDDPNDPTNLDWYELDWQQRQAVQAARTGQCVVIQGHGGSGLTHTCATAIVDAVARGQQVLVVTAHRGTAQTLAAQVRQLAQADLVLDMLDQRLTRTQLCEQLADDIRRASTAPTNAQIDAVAADVEHAIRNYRAAIDPVKSDIAALHHRHEPWGVSAYEAMVALTDLLSRDPAPRTRVRLSPTVCAQLGPNSRATLAADLRRLADMGAFTVTRRDTRWLDAQVTDAEQAEAVLAAARDAQVALPGARAAMDAVIRMSGLTPATTIAQWQPRLDVLLTVRAVLEVLQPQVFDQPLDDLLGALHGSDTLSRADRRSLRRRAIALVRPGAQLDDVPAWFAAAARAAHQWGELAEPGTPPSVPVGLAQAKAAMRDLMGPLSQVMAVLAETVTPDLTTVPLESCEVRLADLAMDGAGLLAQPERTVMIRRLREAGLAELLTDLRTRPVEPEAVGAELEVAWWASVLEAIIRRDPALAQHHSGVAQVQLSTEQVNRKQVATARAGQWRVEQSQRAHVVCQQHPDQAAWLLAAEQHTRHSVWRHDLVTYAGKVLAGIRPVWILSPDAAARWLPADYRVDLVVVDDAHQVGMPVAAATLSRGAQLLIAGDANRLPPATGKPSVLTVLHDIAVQHKAASQQPAHACSPEGASAQKTAAINPHDDVRATVVRLTGEHRACDGRLRAPLAEWYGQWPLVPGARPSSGLRLEYVVEGVCDQPISTDAEVAAVVRLVAEQALRRPGRSLAIVTLGLRHARRIEAALRHAATTRMDLARWLLQHWTDTGTEEPLVVRPIHLLAGVARDDVVVSWGIARMGRHQQWGLLSGRHGTACVATALTRSRYSTTVVSCLNAEDLAGVPTDQPGTQLWRAVVERAGDPVARGDHVGITPHASEPQPGSDALVTDIHSRLVAAGLPVVTTEELDFPAVAVLADPQSYRRLAVDLDGPAAVRLPGGTSQIWQRWRTLERAGWSYVRLSAMDAFGDPQSPVVAVRRAWQQAWEHDHGGGAAGRGIWRSGLDWWDAPAPPELTAEETQTVFRLPETVQRMPFPDVTPGRPITAYSAADLESVAAWVLADGVVRDADELALMVRRALDLSRRTAQIDEHVGGAVRRVLDSWSSV